MSAPPRPPTRLVRFLCVLIGLALFVPIGFRAGRTRGIVAGALLGAPAGWALGGWVKRTFLEF